METKELKILIKCQVCGKGYPINECAELIFEDRDPFNDEEYYVCANCLKDLLWEVRNELKSAMERLRKVNQNPSER